jgi:arsenate reductase
VHPVVRDVMQEVGIDLSQAKPQKLTMGCGDECPYVPGLRRADWPVTDPKDLPLERVRAIRSDIRQRIERLIVEEKIGHH